MKLLYGSADQNTRLDDDAVTSGGLHSLSASYLRPMIVE